MILSLIRALIGLSFLMLLPYGVLAFYELQLNPLEWQPFTRLSLGACVLGIIIVLGLLLADVRKDQPKP